MQELHKQSFVDQLYSHNQSLVERFGMRDCSISNLE